jgi:curli production assembly/transport component CsgG
VRGWRSIGVALAGGLLLAGCGAADLYRKDPIAPASERPELTPQSEIGRDLLNLPPPKGKIVASVYAFRDQTGQYKAAPDSSFSTAVTQGAGAMLVKALADSGWFVPVEREGLQNLLTERRIVRALDTQSAQRQLPDSLQGLLPANILLEGGIIGYEQDIRTGGAGARYFGLGASDQYRTDQVTVNLRAVDIRSGRILVSISTTKSVYSYKLSADMFRFISFKKLLDVEVGYTRNEPAQLCVRDAIEAAVIHLIVSGIHDNHWVLRNSGDINSAMVKGYLDAQRPYLTRSEARQFMGEGDHPLQAPARSNP